MTWRLTGTLIVALVAACAPKRPADTVVYGHLRGSGYTSERVGVVVRDGHISEIVPPREARRHVGPRTQKLRVPVITAGFVDAHGHLSWLGQTLHDVDVSGAATYAEVLARLAAAKGEVVFGHGWDQNDWPDAPEGGWPLASDLVAVLGGRTAVLSRIDGHALWVTPDLLTTLPETDPADGQIVRWNGQPSGVVIDGAMDLVVQPRRPLDRARLVGAMDKLVAAGLTGVHAMSVSDEELTLLESLDAEGALPLRVWAYVMPDSEAAGRLVTRGPWRGQRLAVVGIKHFIDGSLGSRGAWLHDDYADQPGHRGSPQGTVEVLAKDVVAGLKMGVQTAVHAIGDAGVDAALQAFSRARAEVPHIAARLRVEHAQVLSPGALSRFAQLGVVASMQPTHATSDMPWAGDRLGPQRLGRAYAWQDVLRAHAPLAFGSDFPVESYEPRLGLWAAVTRTAVDGTPPGGWMPRQKLAIDQAVDAFTSGAAWAVEEQTRLGQLSPGFLADLSLWDVDERGMWWPVGVLVEGRPSVP